MIQGHDNPYRLSPTQSERLLSLRGFELDMPLHALADPSLRHAALFGASRSGRTSTIREAARRAATGLKRLVVELQLVDTDLTTSGVQRAILTAVAERLVREDEPKPDWYRAWCDRVLLHERTPMSARDALVSGLAFAADSAAAIDPSLFQQDLRVLASFAAERSFDGVVLLVDDADALLEDVELTERLVAHLDVVGGWSLLLSCRPTSGKHLSEAVSPCLHRVRPVPLLPLIPPEVDVYLTEPLSPADAERLLPAVPEQRQALLRDIVDFTNGNPFDIALVARELWAACAFGEQEIYTLTPRVLERALDAQRYYTGIDPSIEEGASAVRRLPPEMIGRALELAAMSRFTPRQVAVTEIIESGVGAEQKLLNCDLDAAEQRVLEELEQLADAGVVALQDGGAFELVGGRVTALTLQHEARAHFGEDTPQVVFGMPFAARVGDQLSENLASRARVRLPGTRVLASGYQHWRWTRSEAPRMRAAINAHKLGSLELWLEPVDREAVDALGERAASKAETSLALVDLALHTDDMDLDWLELWDVPAGVTQHEILQALSDELDRWQEAVEKAGFEWRGSNVALFEHGEAHRALLTLHPGSATIGVHDLFKRWKESGDWSLLDQAIALAAEGLAILPESALPEWRKAWQTSTMLSVSGFLTSMFEDRLADARTALEEAVERGPGDGWVTIWNLGNVAAREGDAPAAYARFASVREALEHYGGKAEVAIHLPGRQTADSLVVVTGENGIPLLNLQLAVLDVSQGKEDANRTAALALAECAGLEDPSAQEAAEWASAALGVPQPAAE